MLRLLSYPLGADTPTWGTNPTPRVTPESLIAHGGRGQLVPDRHDQPQYADLRDHDVARIFLVPLFLEKLDGAPVTILAEMKD